MPSLETVLLWIGVAKPSDLAAVTRAIASRLENTDLVEPRKEGIWRKTPQACEMLDVTPHYLTSAARNGKLKEGVHYKRYNLDFGKSSQTAYLWRVDYCRVAMGLPEEIYECW